jgi:hypothetical protein
MATLAAISMAGCSRFDPLEPVLQFEVGATDGVPEGWGGGPSETLHLDRTVTHGGEAAARLEREAGSEGAFSSLTKKLDVDFTGEWIELRGFLRTEEVTGFAGLWIRQDGESGSVRFDNMHDRGPTGTSAWTEYTIRQPIDPRTRKLFFGVLLTKEGKVWADDLQLTVDGRVLNEAPKVEREKTVLERDREVPSGSRIAQRSMTQAQIENLAVLAEVWGFLKYHHPRVAAGQYHWDFELLRVLPRVLAAESTEARNRSLVEWIDRIGQPLPCDSCGAPQGEVHLPAPIDWIRDSDRLGSDLSNRLLHVYSGRHDEGPQFYVTLVDGIGNPSFDHELPYSDQHPPDGGFRILALARLWNIVEYWFPYRNQLDDDWPSVLREFIPRFLSAEDWDTYRLELLAFVSRIGDTHANLWAALDVRPPVGRCYLPVATGAVEGRVVVTDLLDDRPGPESELEIGDVIESIDDRPVDTLMNQWATYYAASNEARRRNDLASYIGRGPCGDTNIGVRRQNELLTVPTARIPLDQPPRVPRDRPGETFQRLSPQVAYLKLSSVRAADIPGYLEGAEGTRGLVIDIRNYPSEFVVFALGSHLVERPTPFARFTQGDLANPGTFLWGRPEEIEPAAPHYSGRVAILVDDVSISSAEYTAMALRASDQAVVFGSTTAGADGNVSRVALPGGLETMISGIGVFYPDKTPTQRVGIVPDFEVQPTIEGLRQGRDEVLEAAVRYLIGPDVDEQTIRSMTAR